MALIRRTALDLLRLAVVIGAGSLAVYATDLVPGGLEKWLSFTGAFVATFAIVAGACAVAQKKTRCFLRVRVLPLIVAATVTLGPGAALHAWNEVTSHHGNPVPEKTPTALDILIVQPPAEAFERSSHVPRLPPEPEESARWDVQYSVASIVGDSLQLHLRRGNRAAALRAIARSFDPNAGEFGYLRGRSARWSIWRRKPNVERAVVLNVDGVHGRPGETNATNSLPRHWESVLKRARLKVPLSVILRSAGPRRLAAWAAWAGNRHGDAMLLSETGRTLLVDAVVRIATERRIDFLYETLAWRHRPILLFDRTEPLPNALDVDKFLRSGRVTACRKIRSVVTCQSATKPGALNSDVELSFNPDEIDVKKLPGAIYYHVVKHDGRLFIDYWWYFPYNPTAVGRRALCGAGRLACFDHVSDWEGITVAVENDGRNYFPTHVIYAQHEIGVAYEWADLESTWERAGLLDGERPVVYVARDSHASYPDPCPQDCDQVARLARRPRPEGDHDGGLQWGRNEPAKCRQTCLKRLPQTRQGLASHWNATPFFWGNTNCLLARWFCDTAAAPRAPRYQGRFQRPWAPLGREQVPGLDATSSKY